MQLFFQNLIENDINSVSKISALAYSIDNQDLYYFFYDQTSRDDILLALETEKSNYVGSTTDTYNAIIRGSEMFTEDGVIENPDQNFMFLITDGEPYCANGQDIGCEENLCYQDINGVSQASSDGETLITKLEERNIRLYILGIGEFVNNIDKISCLTQNAYIYEMPDFTSEEFKNIEEEFREILCPTNVLPTDPSARSNNYINFDNGQESFMKNHKLTYFILNTFATVIVTFVTSSICFGYFYCCCLKANKILQQQKYLKDESDYV